MKLKRVKTLFNQKAMTLTELLVTIALIAVVTTLLMAILKEGFLSFDRTVNEADVQLSIRHQSDVIVEDIRNSKITEVEEVSYPHFVDNKLVLFTGTKDDPELITYFLDDEKIYRQEGSSPPAVEFENVSCFNVTTDNRLVKITISVNPETSHYQKPIPKEIIVQARPRVTLTTLSN